MRLLRAMSARHLSDPLRPSRSIADLRYAISCHRDRYADVLTGRGETFSTVGGVVEVANVEVLPSTRDQALGRIGSQS